MATKMAKNKITTGTTASLADIKKRAKRGVYGDIAVEIPYSLFEDFTDGIIDNLDYHDVNNLEHFDLAVRADVQQEFERQLNDCEYDGMIIYGGDFDYGFVSDMFATEIEAFEAEEEAREAQEEAEELAKQKEREAEELRRRATLTTIEVSNGNYQKAVNVLKAAGLLN